MIDKHYPSQKFKNQGMMVKPHKQKLKSKLSVQNITEESDNEQDKCAIIEHKLQWRFQRRMCKSSVK